MDTKHTVEYVEALETQNAELLKQQKEQPQLKAIEWGVICLALTEKCIRDRQYAATTREMGKDPRVAFALEKQSQMAYDLVSRLDKLAAQDGQTFSAYQVEKGEFV